jgi:hypothetical protein
MTSTPNAKTLFGDNEDNVACALEDTRIDEKIAIASQQVKDGLGIVADAAFFEGMRERIRQKYMSK